MTRLSAVVAALVACALLTRSTPAGTSAQWTKNEVRELLGQTIVSGTDFAQPDHPSFSFRVRNVRIRGLGPASRRGTTRTWRRFAIAGTALQAGSGTPLSVAFTMTAERNRVFVIERLRGPPPNTSQPTLPVRAAFYYPWYPENWSGRYTPFTRYHPALGSYDSGSAVVVGRHVRALRYGHFDAAISSWWGPGTPTDRRLTVLLDGARQSPVRIAVYYEHEGYADPSVEEIRRHLEYLADRYFSRPAYLRIDGKPVVFVYAPGDDPCLVAARWRAANDVGAYINLDTNNPPSELSTFTPLPASTKGGVRIAAGDLTGTGRSSLVVAPGPGSPPVVSVLDAMSGRVESTFSAGSSPNGVEVAAERGAIVTSLDSTVARWTPAGQLLASTQTGLPSVRVAVGDVDGDGTQEVLTASGATVDVRDGTTLAKIAELTPFGGRGIYGVAAGDVDGDGRAEILVGSSGGRPDEVQALRPDGTVVGSIFDVYPGDVGGLRVGSGDLNGDGRAEVITGPALGAPDIHTYTLGRNGFFQDPPVGFFAFGAGRCPCPDPNLPGGVTVATANIGSLGHASLVTATGADQPPLVRTWASFDTCPAQPEAWHYYGLSETGDYHLPDAHSSTIVPGFFYAGDRDARLQRDLRRWKENVRGMVAAHDPWQLVVSFNEWAEGTSVEPAREWTSRSGFGAYLDVLHNRS